MQISISNALTPPPPEPGHSSHSSHAISCALALLKEIRPLPQELSPEPFTQLPPEERVVLFETISEECKKLPPINLDMLNLIHGDPFLMGSKLDKGGHTNQNAWLLLNLLDHLPPICDLKPVKNKLSELIHWGKVLETLPSEHFLEDLIEIAEKICAKIKGLHIGESLNIPGGYKSKSAAHALIYEIIKTGDNEFTFQIINTGAGAEYHYQSYLGLKTKIYPLYTISNITFEELTRNNDFFIALLAFKSNPYCRTDMEGKEIYALVTEYFKKKPISTQEIISEDLITSQRSGTCSWKCLMALMRINLKKEDYKTLVFLIKQLTLTSYFINEYSRKKTSQTEQVRTLVKLFTKKLSLRGAKTLLQNLPHFNQETIRSSQALIETILLTIQENERADYRAKSNPRRYNLKYVPTIIRSIVLPYPPTLEALSLTPEAPPEPIPSFNFRDHLFSDNVSLCDSFLIKFKDNLRLQRELLIAFVKAAPSPLRDKQYYKCIDLPQIPLILSKLYSYFKSYFELGVQNHFCITIDKITLFSFHAICLELSLNYEEKKGIPDEDRLSSIFTIDLNRDSFLKPSNWIHLPDDIKRWQDLSAYFGQMAPKQIIHQQKYTLTHKNPYSHDHKKRLGNLFYDLVTRHSNKLRLSASEDTFRIAALLISGSETPEFKEGATRTLFDALNLPHLQILKLMSRGIQFVVEGDVNDINGYESKLSMDHCDLELNPLRKAKNPWADNVLPKDGQRDLESLALRSNDFYKENPSVIEFWNKEETTVLGRTAVNHALSHNPLRHIELLSFALTHLDLFKSEELSSHFLQQFFKLTYSADRPHQQLFELIHDDKFQKAFLDFLKTSHDLQSNSDSESFSIFTFAMQLGVLILPHIDEMVFRDKVCRALSPLYEEATRRTNRLEIYTLSLLIGLKETFILQKLLTESESADLLESPLHSLLMCWMRINTSQFNLPNFNHIERMLEDLIYELFANPPIAAWIHSHHHALLPEILKNIIDLTIPTSTVCTPSAENQLVFTFNDENQTSVNLYTGSISNRLGPITISIQDEIYNHLLFKELFKNKKDFQFNYNASWYYFTTPDLVSYRVKFQNDEEQRYNATNRFILQRMIKSSWSRLLATPTLEGYKGEFPKAILRICPILETDFFCFDHPEGYFFFPKEDDISFAYLMPRGAEALEILKIDKDSLQEISRLTPAFQLSEDFKDYISRFEDPAYVYVETIADAIKLVFIRYQSHSGSNHPLTFISKGAEWLLESNQSKKLCSDISVTLIGDFNSFIVTETITTGNRSALIPFLEYEDELPSFAGGGKLKIPNKRGIQTVSLTYDDILLHGDLLCPATLKDKLRCSTLKIGQRKLFQALTYLKQIPKSDLKTEDTLNQVKECLAFLERVDKSPEAIALGMHLRYLINYYRFMKGLEKDANRGEIYNQECNLYEIYCNLLAHIPFDFRLSFEEESLFLQMLIKLVGDRSSFSLPTFAQRRIASCPQIIPAGMVAPQPPQTLFSNLFSYKHGMTLTASWFNSSRLIHLKVNELKAICQKTYDDLNVSTFFALLRKSYLFLVYDLIYRARENVDKKCYLNQILHIGFHLNAYNREFIETCFIILNYTSSKPDPLPLFNYQERESKPFDDFESHQKWIENLNDHFKIMNGRKTVYQLPDKDLRTCQVPYPHLSVITPSSAQTLLSFTHPLPRSPALDDLLALREELESSSIPFIYGSETIPLTSMTDLRSVVACQSAPQLKSAIDKEFEDFIQGFSTITERDERAIPYLTVTTLSEISEKLIEMMGTTEAQLNLLLQEIFKLAHGQSADQKIALIDSQVMVSGLSKKLTFEKLLFLFLSGNQEAFLKACPHLDVSQIQILNQMVRDYLYLSIHFTQMNRLKTTATTLNEALTAEKLSSTAESLEGGRIIHSHIASISLELKMIARQKMKVNPTPQELLFFSTSQMMYRTNPPQERLIEELARAPHKVAQVIMGGGKTTVIAANLLAKACSEGKIAIMLTPAFQYQSLYKTMQHKLKNIFDIEVVTFHYEREELTFERLEALEQTLVMVKNSAANEEPKVLLLCPETFQLLTLEYLDTLKKLSLDNSLLPKFQILARIFQLLKTDGYALGDEVHILLDIVKEIYTPVGAPHKVDQENITLIRNIFTLIYGCQITLTTEEKKALEEYLSPTEKAQLVYFQESEGLFKAKIDQFIKLKENKQSYFSIKLYQEILLPKIANYLVRFQKKTLMLFDPAEQSGFTRYIQGKMEGKIQRALMNPELRRTLSNTESEDLDFLFKIQTLHKSPNPEEKKAADLIALSKYILADLLPVALSKTARIQFGRTYDQKNLGKVVPYIAPDTPSSNEFGNQYEAIIYHLITALIYGVEDEQIKQLFASWHEEATKLSLIHIPYEQTRPVKICKSLFGILPNELNEKFAQIRASLEEDTPEALDQRFAIERHTIDRFVRYQTERHQANAHMLVDLFEKVTALSGTPDIYTLSKKLQNDPFLDLSVNPLCIRAFLEKPSQILISSVTTPDEFMNEQFEKLQPTERNKTYALLDAGGLFKDYENKTIAKALFQKLQRDRRSEIQAIIFFTRLNGSATADYPVLMRSLEGEVEPLNGTSKEELLEKGLKVGQYGVYLDSRHCTGIDIKLPQTAVGFLTYDPSMGIDDTTQAMMRFRDYLMGQSLSVVVPNYTCGSFPKSKLPLQQLVETDQLEAKKILIAQMIIKQVDQRSKKMVKSFRKMLENTIFQHALSLLQTHQKSLPNISKIRNGFKSFLSCFSDDTPYKSFGSLSEEVDTLESLEKTRDKLLEQLTCDLKAAGFIEDSSPLGIDPILQAITGQHKVILGRVVEIKSRFISTVWDMILGEDPSSNEGGEKEVSAHVDQRSEERVEVQLQQTTEEELTSLQSSSIKDPEYLSSFESESFLKALSFSPLSSDVPIEPLKNLFLTDTRLHAYARLFDDTPALFITRFFKKPFVVQTNLFDSTHLIVRPFQHLLVCEVHDDNYKAVIVSEFESERLTLHLRANPSIRTVWLTEPSGHLQAGNQDTWTLILKNDSIKKMMTIFNLLGANTHYLFNNLKCYVNWYRKDQEMEQSGGVSYRPNAILKQNFIKLLAAAHPLEAKLILNHLLRDSQLQQLLDASQELSDEIFDPTFIDLQDRDLQQLSPEELSKLKPKWIEKIGKRLTPKQIPYLSFECILKLDPEQLAHLDPKQVNDFKAQDQIARLPCEVIAKLRDEDLTNQVILERLNQEQYGALTDKALIRKIPLIKLRYINFRLTHYLGNEVDKLRELTPQHVAYLSHEQLTALKAANERSVFEKIPCDAINTLPLTAPTEDGKGFILYLTSEQKSYLTPAQIGLIKDKTEFKHLNPIQWQHANNPDLLSDINPANIPFQDLTPLLFSKLPINQYPRFVENQIKKVPQDKFIYLTEEQKNWITPEQISSISDINILRNLPPLKWGYALQGLIDQLSQADLFRINQPNFSIDLLKKLSHDQLGYINAQAIIPLIRPQDLSHDFLQKLSPVHAKYFNQEQLVAIPTKPLYIRLIGNSINWEHARKEVIESLSLNELIAYCPTQLMKQDRFLEKLTRNQFKYLIQIAKVPQDKFICLTEEQKNWITPEQIISISDINILRNLPPLKWGYALQGLIDQLSQADLFRINQPNFSIDLLKKLSHDQLGYINAQAIIPLIRPQDLSHNFLQKLSPVHAKYFNQEQLVAIPTKALYIRLIENSINWEHARKDVIQSLSSNELIAYCPTQLMERDRFLGKLSTIQFRDLNQDYVQAISNINYYIKCKSIFLSTAQKEELTKIKNYKWVQFFSMPPSCLKYCNRMQRIAYTIGQITNTLFYLLLSPLIFSAKMITWSYPISVIDILYAKMWDTFLQFQQRILLRYGDVF